MNHYPSPNLTLALTPTRNNFDQAAYNLAKSQWDAENEAMQAQLGGNTIEVEIADDSNQVCVTLSDAFQMKYILANLPFTTPESAASAKLSYGGIPLTDEQRLRDVDDIATGAVLNLSNADLDQVSKLTIAAPTCSVVPQQIDYKKYILADVRAGNEDVLSPCHFYNPKSYEVALLCFTSYKVEPEIEAERPAQRRDSEEDA